MNNERPLGGTLNEHECPFFSSRGKPVTLSWQLAFAVHACQQYSTHTERSPHLINAATLFIHTTSIAMESYGHLCGVSCRLKSRNLDFTLKEKRFDYHSVHSHIDVEPVCVGEEVPELNGTRLSSEVY